MEEDHLLEERDREETDGREAKNRKKKEEERITTREKKGKSARNLGALLSLCAFYFYFFVYFQVGHLMQLRY